MSSLSRLVSSARSHTCSDHVLSFDWCMHQVHRHFRATKHFGFSLPHAALNALVSFVQFRLHQASRQSVALTCVRARVWSLFFPVGIAQLNNIGGPIPVLCFSMFATGSGVAFPVVKCVSLKVYAAPWNPAVPSAKLSSQIRLSSFLEVRGSSFFSASDFRRCTKQCLPKNGCWLRLLGSRLKHD